MASGFYETDQNHRRCFRPHVPSPPRIEAVIDLLDGALDAIRRFDRKLGDWEHPAVIGRLFARLDAVHSSGAEGSTTTFTDLLEFESSLKSAPDVDDAAAVSACADALDEVADDNLIKVVERLHKRLFERSRDKMVAASAGRLKERTNGTADEDSHGGFFFYTKPSSVEPALTDWQAFTLESDPTLPELVRQSLSHWMFELIHPTHDGNGRVGRLLVPLVLRAKGVTKASCAFFSESAHEDKHLYVEALKQARMSGDMTGWTRLILGFLKETAEANLSRIDALSDLLIEWRQAVAGFRSDSAVHRLVGYAITKPAFTITDAVADVGGTFASVNAAAGKLESMGILAIAEGRRRDRLFQAPAVLDLFDRFRAPAAAMAP